MNRTKTLISGIPSKCSYADMMKTFLISKSPHSIAKNINVWIINNCLTALIILNIRKHPGKGLRYTDIIIFIAWDFDVKHCVSEVWWLEHWDSIPEPKVPVEIHVFHINKIASS